MPSHPIPSHPALRRRERCRRSSHIRRIHARRTIHPNLPIRPLLTRVSPVHMGHTVHCHAVPRHTTPYRTYRACLPCAMYAICCVCALQCYLYGGVVLRCDDAVGGGTLTWRVQLSTLLRRHGGTEGKRGRDGRQTAYGTESRRGDLADSESGGES